MEPTGIESEPELLGKENTIDEGCLPEGLYTMSYSNISINDHKFYETTLLYN